MRARVLAVVCMLGAGVAWGNWYGEFITGLPRDVIILDAGQFIAISSSGPVLFTCNAGTCAQAPSDAGNVTGALMDQNGCVFGFLANGTITGCGYTGGSVPGFMNGTRAMSCLPNGSCLVVGVGAPSTAHYAFNVGPPQIAASWTPATGLAGIQPVLPPRIPTSGVTVGGVDWFVMAAAGKGMLVIVDGGVSNPGPTLYPGLSTNPNDLAIFRRPDGKVGIVAALNDPAPERERYGADLTIGSDAGWLPIPITIETGGLKVFAYAESNGSSFGYGFGMGSQRDGGGLLASPVPNPNSPGMVWVQRPGTGKPSLSIRCVDATFCAAVANDTMNPNVFYYWNEGGASGSVRFAGAAQPLVEGSSAQLIAQYADYDGDPTWLTWLDGGGLVTISAVPDGGPSATITALPNPLGPCTSSFSVTAMTSDGLASHDTVIFLDAGQLYQRTTPDPVTVTPSQARLDAGQSVTFTADAMGGQCPGTLTWQVLPDAGSLVVTGPITATYTAPTHVCAADAGAVVFASGRLDGGASSTPAFAVVHLEPWGPPNTPSFSGTGMFTQDSGTRVTYPYAGPPHVCMAAPVNVLLLDAGAPATVDVTADVAGVTVDSMNGCVGGTVSAVVAFDTSGMVSPPTSMSVQLVPDTRPLVNPPFSMNLQVDAGGAVHGVFTVGASCLPQRGLQAEAVVTGGSITARTGRLSVVAPTPWSVQLLGLCNGGSFTANATLYEDGGVVATEMRGFDAGQTPAGVGDLDPFELPVTCDGVDAQLRLTLPPGACAYANTNVTWAQASGPPVEPLATSDAVNVRTVARQLDGLIGETLTFDIVADATMGNLARATRSVRLVPARFVSVAHRMTPVAASSDDVVTVSVDVRNNGTCRVTGVVLEESPTGLRFIDGTARIDGAPVSGTGKPIIGPFDLEGGQTRKVTWLAKTSLLATAKARGTAYIAGLPVSEDEPELDPPSGCGCSASPAGAFALALVSLLRRRRAAPLSPTGERELGFRPSPRLRALSPTRTSRRSASRSRPS